MILVHPALGLLLRLKLKASLRRQRMRFQSPSGAIFALIGLVLLTSWLAMLAFHWGSRRSGLEGELLVRAVQAAALGLTVLTAASSFSHRGLYLPKAEIELLLSAPVRRVDLVRYRILAGTARALFGGVVIGLMTMGGAPRPEFAFAGVVLGTLALPVLGQGVSLLAGDAENRLVARLSRLPFRWVNFAAAALLALFVFAMMRGDEWSFDLGALGPEGGMEGILGHPVLGVVTAPFRPWALMITAGDLPSFALWLLVCAALWVALFELVARIPVDFRELSLATSADVARRLSRRQRGAGAWSAAASRGSAGRPVPWLFGRGPFGAIAWRKSASILRKARGTLFTSAVILGALTIFSTFVSPANAPPAAVGSTIIALVGTVYLCAGLRFDFREDLERMESVKSWPVRPWQAFLATILPEVALVSALIAVAIGLRAAFTGQYHPSVAGIVAAVPLVVSTWTSIDNLVFLYAPVRFTPGQEGALHHTGRAMVLMLLRMVVFGAVAAMLLLAVGAAFLAQQLLGLSDAAVLALGLSLGALVLFLENAALVAVGGRMFRRFDVARDRG